MDPAYRDQQQAIMPEPNRLNETGDRMAAFYNEASFAKELLDKIKCPVLLMPVENDGNSHLTTSIITYLMIPNSQLGIIPNAGHGVFLENFPAVLYRLFFF